MEQAPQERVSLIKTLTRGEIWAFAFGSIVGWGWVMLAGGWVNSAGMMGAIIAMVIGAVLCCLVGMAYAELTPALPMAGGSMVWAFRAGGVQLLLVQRLGHCLRLCGRGRLGRSGLCHGHSLSLPHP